VQAEAVRLKNFGGQDVARLDLHHLDSRDYYFVHRADLIDLLAQGAREAGAKIQLLQHGMAIEDGTARHAAAEPW
jgi:salicylate hydroxylase